MDNTPFSDPDINSQIKVKVLRLQAASLEWWDNPGGANHQDHVVETSVKCLDAHAQAYLCKVDRQQLIDEYRDYVHGVAGALIRNVEHELDLRDPASDHRLRKMAVNSGPFISRISSMTPEAAELEIRNEIERLRFEVRAEAGEWADWKNELLLRLEIRFEARFQYWVAEAIERVRSHPEATGSQAVRGDVETSNNPKGEEPWNDARVQTEAEDVAARAKRRQAFVNPILKAKRWTRCRLATYAGVSKNSVYYYLDGRLRKLTAANRKAITEALGVNEEALPN
jgi:hypothetical protein